MAIFNSSFDITGGIVHPKKSRETILELQELRPRSPCNSEVGQLGKGSAKRCRGAKVISEKYHWNDGEQHIEWLMISKWTYFSLVTLAGLVNNSNDHNLSRTSDWSRTRMLGKICDCNPYLEVEIMGYAWSFWFWFPNKSIELVNAVVNDWSPFCCFNNRSYMMSCYAVVFWLFVAGHVGSALLRSS